MGRYLKEIPILNSFSFEDKDPRFARLKPGLALRLLSKGLFYIWYMPTKKPKIATCTFGKCKKGFEGQERF